MSRLVAIGEIAELSPRPEPNDVVDPQAPVAFVPMSAVSEDGRIFGAQLRPHVEVSRGYTPFEEGDVIVAKITPCFENGKAALVRGVPARRCFGSTEFHVLRAGPELDARYLFYAVRTPEFRLDGARNMTGSAGQRRVPASFIRSYKIYLPPLERQKRIAGILDKADGVRRKRRDAIKLADDLLRATFLEMFGDPVTNPKGWERVRLGDVLQDGPQNGLYKPASDYGTGTPILRIDAFYDGVVKDIGSLKRVRVSDSERKRFGLKANDIVVNRVNSMEYLGKSALIPDLQEPTVFESNMMRFRVETNLASPAFVVQFLQSSYIKSQIAQAAKHAVNQSSINQQDVGSFELLLPPVGLQTQFMSASKRIHALKHSCRAAVEHDDALFQSLMQRAFTGRL